MKEDKAERGRARGGLYSEGISDTMCGGIKIPSSEDKGEVNLSSPHGKKRAASEDSEKKAPERG